MKHHLLDWILLYVASLIVLWCSQYAYHQVMEAYYTYAPIETFYKSESFIAQDICKGATKQTINLKRYVYGTDIGYSGEIIREMLLFKDGQAVKVYDDVSLPFIEVRLDGVVTRVQNVPPDLEIGEYQWIVYLTLKVHGVQRTDIPPKVSNLFKVKECI